MNPTQSPNVTPADSSFVVHKFGGSSVADAACMLQVARLVEADPHARVAVVLSACKGVTDTLLSLVTLAESGAAYEDAVTALRARHETLARTVLSERVSDAFISLLDQDCRDITGILQSVRLLRSAGDNMRELLAGFGEIWSTRLFAALLEARASRAGDIRWVDARQLIVVDKASLGPSVRWADSRAKLTALGLTPAPVTLVIPGFIASDRLGIQTTLGRNGSDFSASIVGALTAAEEIIIWTDVDGVLSADPRRVPDAKVIDALSYNEAMELAYFGAKVIHPQTMAPAVEREIPIVIKNTFAPERAGTRISARPQSQLTVKGITTIDDVALLNLEGAGMIGVPGTAERLFGALRNAGISVILISQGSSEHSICCAIPQRQMASARTVVERAFALELQEGQIQRVELNDGLAIVAVVGDGMAGSHGVAAKVCTALADAGINIRAIAQGASERNISFVIEAKQSTRALRAVHAAFYLSPHAVSIGLIGPGVVGGEPLNQLSSQLQRLAKTANLDLRVRGVLTSKRMLLTEHSISPADWQAATSGPATSAVLTDFVKHIHTEHLPHAVIVDCSASESVATLYAEWLRAGIHVVTPNKKANSGPLDYRQAITDAAKAGGTHYLYETTVGAGLPVIQTLRELLNTGDEIRSVEGMFSGTLAFLFNSYDGVAPFSEIVKSAKVKGYTEPDPRDDLSGTDVARKIVILAREIGLKIELSDVLVESLVPTALQSVSVSEYLERLPQFDEQMASRFKAASAQGKVLRYVGRLEASGSARVGLVELPRTHAFANSALTDNVVRFETRRYCDNPLIVQGPGAGPEVTAGGVFGDLLRLCAYLGAKI